MPAAPTSWPIAGLLHFVRHPRLWLAPMLAMVVGWSLIAGLSVGILVWRWPDWQGDLGWWRATLAIAGDLALALALAVAAALLAWATVLPLVLGLAMERLAKQVQRQAGAVEVAEEPLLRSLRSTLRVIIGTLPTRLGWLVVGILASLLLGPFGIPIAALAMTRVAMIDALDVALAMRGLDGRERLRLLRGSRDASAGALPAAGLNLLLALSVVGWPFWLPGLVTGAALRVLAWPEIQARLAAPAPRP